nr:protein argonaute 2-like [Tanacetum cinerariifolium]
ASNTLSPSVAAVVGSINWPAATRYAARVSPQKHRKEEIVNFGSLCLDLIKSYVKENGVRPNKIIVFRDGVSDGQFDMVLNKEMVDLKKTIYTEQYRPWITFVVAQKRHTTLYYADLVAYRGRMFQEVAMEMESSGSAPSSFNQYPKEELGKDAQRKLRELSLLAPEVRRREISNMVHQEYATGRNGAEVIKNFDLEVGMEMTEVDGRVMAPPRLKLGSLSAITQMIICSCPLLFLLDSSTTIERTRSILTPSDSSLVLDQCTITGSSI